VILKRPVHIARSGKIIGEFSSSELGGMLEGGQLLPDDLCYLEEQNLWVPLRDYINASSLPKFQPPMATKGEEGAGEAGAFVLALSSPALIVLGWVAFLFACGALAGTGVWIYSLQGEIARSGAELKSLRNRLQNQELEYRELLTRRESGEDKGTVSGKVVLQSEKGEPILMPDFVLRLYERAAIEEHLRRHAPELAAFAQSGDSAKLAVVLNSLPRPVAETSTNAIGEYEIDLPDEGQYVIHSSMSVPSGGAPRILFWFLGCSANDPLALPVNVTDWNRVGNFQPDLLIVPGR
jgi:hypothetical protein